MPGNGANDDTKDVSLHDKLVDLTAQATALYSVKKYEEAAELYSQATEIQAEANGEMAEENAELLFAYGRCLFHVAQKTSTVLGGTAASAQLKGSDKKPSKKRAANGSLKTEGSSTKVGSSTSLQPITETAEPADVLPAEDIEPKESTSDKPLFQISGDSADWDDSEDEEEDDEENEEEEEDEDDFQTAFEILDTSRILYLRKLESLKSSQSPSPSPEENQTLLDLKTRISEIYDLQSEISLEGEKYDAAVSDLKSCLALKQELYPPDSSLLAECHYKLSLALEAASQIQQRDADGNPVGEFSIDWTLRNEAVTQQEKAIESCRLRIVREEKELEDLTSEKEKAKAKEQIDDVQDMTNAMEQRLAELKKPPISVKAEAEKDAQQELMGTVLGEMLGAGKTGKEDQKQKLAEIVASANDLSGMVKKKKPKQTDGSSTVVQRSEETEMNGKGKRKIDDVEAEGETSTNGQSTVKKVRIEDVID